MEGLGRIPRLLHLHWMAKSVLKHRIPQVSSKVTPTQSDVPPKRGFRRLLLFLTTSSLLATIASRILPHIGAAGGDRSDLVAFICTTAVLLNVSAAISAITLSAMGIELNFRLSRMEGLGRIPRLLHLHWMVCTLGGLGSMVAVLVPYRKAIFTWI